MRDANGVLLRERDIVAVRSGGSSNYSFHRVTQLLEMPDLQEGARLRSLRGIARGLEITTLTFSSKRILLVCDDYRDARASWLANLFPELTELRNLRAVKRLTSLMAAEVPHA